MEKELTRVERLYGYRFALNALKTKLVGKATTARIAGKAPKK